MSVKFDKKSFKPSQELSNAQTYAANAIAYCRRSGRANGVHPVIQQGSAEWSRWMQYFDHIGHEHAKPNSFAQRIGRLTVPSKTPDEFEPGWQAAPAPDALLPPSPKKHTHANDAMSVVERAAARARGDKIYADYKSGVAGQRMKESFETDAQKKREASRWLDSHKDGQGLSPVGVSDGFATKLADQFKK